MGWPRPRDPGSKRAGKLRNRGERLQNWGSKVARDLTRKGAWRLEYRATGRARYGTMNRAGSMAKRLRGTVTEELCRA